MRLKQKQKKALLQWIAEGLESPEIRIKAKKFKPAFDVSRQQVDYYRQSRKIKVRQIQASGEHDALSSGLALKAERVKTLKQLAQTLLEDLTRENDNRRWLKNAKMIGGGESQVRIDYEEFNKPEFDTLRGILDDIAQEIGDRIRGVDFTSGGKEITIVPLGVKIEDV